MTATASLRRGWCPGALRPMRTGDGLLVRLRITGGIVPARLARAIADCARTFGSGAIDLSAKANLQLRGVRDDTLEPLTARLAELGVLDMDADAEAVRNVVSSPLAGLDPSAVLDVRPIVAALERRLSGDGALHALPAKFGFLVDDGGRFGPRDVSVDVRFEAIATAGGPEFRVRLGGSGEKAATSGACAPEAVPDLAAAIASTFIALREERGPEAPRRMRGMLAGVGLETFARVSGASRAVQGASSSRLPAPQPLGRHDLGPGVTVFGVGAPFGRWSADDLDTLADWSERFGVAELRLTPWRAIVIPVRAPSRTDAATQTGAPAAALAALAGSRFIIDPADPRLAVVACPGAPDCLNATTRTRDDASALADVARRLVPGGVTLHVSGCPKGCAHPDATAVALVGRDGLYDLVQRGRAGDAPAAIGLNVAQARAALIDGAGEKR
ncbi:precorrin-3B synthase [Alsobacter metallidurans]|uniref:Precorrin-3B synthase n=1 Tax=Alsobacter metallidurans TaxID=340221 RepID=A0A917MGI2_9HYPH|nr:precorrin-3B synthase [Alsobacter metallidurans]GGH10511.1 precorrin-3B synthase [Alsobacter metallidurans]